MPNIVGSFAGPTPGHHLVLNGHMDVFPVHAARALDTRPGSGAIATARFTGRG